MGEGVIRQRLAAILAADAVGYSRLMEADEQTTVATLDAAREVFRAAIESNHGHVINTAGDSVLAVFDTAAGAVTAALTAQRTLNASSLDTSDDRRMRFRVGVHLGDVIEKVDGDLYGDGVNIAARLQALADPGGIIVSEAVRGAVKSRVAATFDDRGEQRIKNIADPVRAFSVRVEGSSELPTVVAPPPPGSRRRMTGLMAVAVALLIGAGVAFFLRSGNSPPVVTTDQTPVAATPASGKPSIAVLPFDNMSGDPAQAYFADGITEDLITDLSKVSGLFVIARNSTFAYKGKARDVREIGKALGARYVLEGSVQRNGSDIRVNAQLIDSATGGHMWADRYDGDMKNIFGLQDTVTRSVVKALAVELTKDDADRVAHRGTDNVRAYDAYLKGWEHYRKQTPEEFRAAIAEFKKAAELDPNYGLAYAALAAIYWESYTRYWSQAIGLGVSRNEEALYMAEQYLEKAKRQPTPLAYQVASAMDLHSQQTDEAIAEARHAIAADPNDADGYIALAGALSFAGKPDEALDAVGHAMRLDPHFPSSYVYQLGLAQFGANRLPEAAASLERALAMTPDDYWSQRLLLATYGLLGRRDDAARLVETIRRNDQRGTRAYSLDPLTVRAVAYWYRFAKPADANRLADGLRKAGVPD
jgi:TolB-like protein/class 3 adenylate cyclase/Flp pilus assembly protein TadD